MAYTKTNYVDGVTPLNAKNFNKNEGALEQVSKDIDSLSSAIAQVDTKVDTKANASHTHSEYATTSSLNSKVDKVSGKGLSTNDFTTAEKNKLAGLQNSDVNKLYVDTELGKKANSSHAHSEYTTESRVSNMIAEAQLGGGEVDLSGYATKEELNTKANISHTHTEYASKSSEHTHTNKTVLDGITESKVNSWDSKATGNHNHDGKYAAISHRHDASEIDNLPTGGGGSTVVVDNLTSTSTTSALSANQGKVLDNKISVLNDKVDNHLQNHPSGEGGSFEIITPNGRSIKVKAMNDGTLETELPVIPTSELPSDFPKFTVTGESKYKGNFLITPHDNNYNFGYFIILNNNGEVIYYKKTNKGQLYALKKYENSKGKNRYTFMEVVSGQEPTGVPFYEHAELVVLDENFEEIDRVRHRKHGDIKHNAPAENHDYVYIDDGHYIIASYYKISGSSFYENSLQELKNRKVLFHWQTKDYSELKQASHTTPTGDYAHFNSIQIDYDGNWLVSFRNIGIVKINRQSKGEVMWIMGKNRNDFDNMSESQMCYQQHDIQLMPDGSFTVFDNYGHNQSRVCRYFLDESSMQCIGYKEYITKYYKSGFMGSATVVDDLNDILDIAYGGGYDIGFEEYDFKNNKQLMKLVFDDGSDMYRVYREVKYNNSSNIEISAPETVRVTGVSISNSNATIFEGDTLKLSANVIPSNASNKKIVWSSSDELIATVDSVGTVKGIAEGIASITCTTEDGGFSKSCNVSIEHKVEIVPIYRLESPFKGNGSSEYVNTNIKLYDTDKDWTIHFKYLNDITVNSSTNGQANIISCFSEKTPYRGLLIKHASDYQGLADATLINLGVGLSQAKSYLEGGSVCLSIVKIGNAYKMYDKSGIVVNEFTSSVGNAYDGSVYLGCATDVNGNPFRFCNATIEKFEIYEKALSVSELIDIMNK